jgi:hypothetical protein
MPQEKLERADMTRSLVALVAALGCFGAEPTADPLLAVRRIYVAELNGTSSAQIRDMLINALQSSKVFAITEKEEKADAVLRGSAEDLIFTDTFQSSEGVQARGAIGGSGTRATSSRFPGASVSVGEQESTRIAERKHEATAAVRLVNKDGEVIWATTQESTGAKFRGASADVAEKIVKQLLADTEKARRPEPRAPVQ